MLLNPECMCHMIQFSTALPLTLPASRHLPARLLLPINPKGSVCGADPPVKVPWSNSRCEHPPSLSFFLLSPSPTLISLPLSTTSHPLPPPCSYEFSISFFGEKISNGGREEDISPVPTGECIWPSVYVCFIKAVKQSTQHKQQCIYTHSGTRTHTYTHRCARVYLFFSHKHKISTDAHTFCSRLLHMHGFSL